MFSHIMIGTDDINTSRAFYDALLSKLEIEKGFSDGQGKVFYSSHNGVFAITTPINGEAASIANGNTIGFLARSPEQVHAWHEAGLAMGGTSCEDPPGVRDLGAGGKLYAAYLRDPSGHKLCVVHRMA